MSGQPDSDLPRFRFGISIGRIGYGVGDEPKAPRPIVASTRLGTGDNRSASLRRLRSISI
jgi:hypothetical protein